MKQRRLLVEWEPVENIDHYTLIAIASGATAPNQMFVLERVFKNRVTLFVPVGVPINIYISAWKGTDAKRVEAMTVCTSNW